MRPHRSLLSIVVPVYNEQENLEEMRRQLCGVIDKLDVDAAEVLFVSDGSTDGTEALVESFVRNDARIKGIFLTRNFGHQAAVSVGIDAALGSVVAVIDGDLQDPPEVLPALLEAIDQGADVAFGVRRHRKEGPFKRAAYWLFYRVLHSISSTEIPLDAGDFCCMTRRVVDAMKRLPETRRFVRGLRAWVGYKQVGVEYDRDQRYAGSPKYTPVKLFALAYDGLFAFSSAPVKMLQVLGFVAALVAAVVALVYLVLAVIVETPRGFPTLMVSIWFLAGVQLLSLGLLGEYVHRTYEESRRRPSALVRKVACQQLDHT